MKKIFLGLSIAVIIFAGSSCSEDLNPYGDFLQKYALNCVVRGDTTFQTATLTSDYMVQGTNPYSNTADPNVRAATIRLWSGNDTVAVLKDTTIARPAGDPYQTPYTVFYSNRFQPMPGSVLTIEALLRNGKRLTSSTVVPLSIGMRTADAAVPPQGKNFLTFAYNSDQKDPVFITRLAIYYFKHANGQKTRNLAVIPANYVDYNGKAIPIYPKPTSDLGFTVDMNTVNKTMELISAGDPDKSSYEILGCIFEVLSLDKNLSAYYNSTARSRDIYSVKLDETDYSNITGGFGVFGVYERTYSVAFLSWAYIRSYGYTPGLMDGQ